MRELPSCRWCGAVAVFRFATVAPSRSEPRATLEDRPRFACALHFPDIVAGLAGAGELLALDPMFTAAALPAQTNDETRPLPPLRENLGPRRRPPAPEVRELRGAELLRALAVELEREDLADEQQPQPCAAGIVLGRPCRWPETGHPCLGYGSEGCGMKAQEQ